jgi:hypothetical protein
MTIFGWFRRRRERQYVTMQLVARGREVTLEGTLLTRKPVGGRYVLANARLIEDTRRTHSALGTVNIPAANVLFWQVRQTVAASDIADLAELVTGEQED